MAVWSWDLCLKRCRIVCECTRNRHKETVCSQLYPNMDVQLPCGYILNLTAVCDTDSVHIQHFSECPCSCIRYQKFMAAYRWTTTRCGCCVYDSFHYGQCCTREWVSATSAQQSRYQISPHQASCHKVSQLSRLLEGLTSSFGSCRSRLRTAGLDCRSHVNWKGDWGIEQRMRQREFDIARVPLFHRRFTRAFLWTSITLGVLQTVRYCVMSPWNVRGMSIRFVSDKVRGLSLSIDWRLE